MNQKRPYCNPAPRIKKAVRLTKEKNSFLKSLKPWNAKQWNGNLGSAEKNTKLRNIKSAIKSYLKILQHNYCAYCGLNLELAYKTNIEHIAPKSKHETFVFTLKNLVLACVYCNDFKNKKDTVVVSHKKYQFVKFSILHPYRDNFIKELECDLVDGSLVFSLKKRASNKAKKTIEILGLNDPRRVLQRSALINQYNKYGLSNEIENKIATVSSQTRTSK